MAPSPKNPRVLIVTPEVTYLPKGMGNIANYLTAKAGGLADVSAALISALFDQGADVHIAMPDYRAIFDDRLPPLLRKGRKAIAQRMPSEKIHLAEDRAFYYLDRVYSTYDGVNTKIALAFQREVMNHIIPIVQPDLIHCNDWMTGLIPAMSREMGIPCLFTVHNIHTVKMQLSQIEEAGIDAAEFWEKLYFENAPGTYEETRDINPVDFLISGVFAAHFVNTVSPTFLKEMVEGHHHFVDPPMRHELKSKWEAECAVGILNAPDPVFDPVSDKNLAQRYQPKNHVAGKKANKRAIQKALSLVQDEKAPLFFWPSRLDMLQKGCQLFADILYHVVSQFWDQKLSVVFVANGEFRRHFEDIANFHGLHKRVAICDFNEQLACLAYGASDFVLMPSLFEPCGLPQMIGPIYGALPIAHDTGGIHDTVSHLAISQNKGNGFLFDTFDATGLLWAIGQAMDFYSLPPDVKSRQIRRIMRQSKASFNHDVTAGQYIDLYEKMLHRPLVN